MRRELNQKVRLDGGNEVIGDEAFSEELSGQSRMGVRPVGSEATDEVVNQVRELSRTLHRTEMGRFDGSQLRAADLGHHGLGGRQRRGLIERAGDDQRRAANACVAGTTIHARHRTASGRVSRR